MGLSKEQIIKILSLKGLGRRTVFRICRLAIDKKFSNDSDDELYKFLENLRFEGSVQRLSYFTSQDFSIAIKRAKDIIKKSEEKDIKIVSYFEKDYPDSLKELKDPPIIINYKGNLARLKDLVGIAIIGTRKPTPEGYKSGKFFGKYFGGLGFNIVSGLASGCDTSAHIGCLESNGFTTAILAHGLHTVYPKENKDLAASILDNGGLLISEYFVGTSARPNYFVERDRLQSGLSVATVVVQTAIKGGTMHAVNATIASKKILAVVEYKNTFDSEKILGNQMLIRDKNAFALKSDNYQDLLRLIKDSLKNESNIKTKIIDSTMPESPQYKIEF